MRSNRRLMTCALLAVVAFVVPSLVAGGGGPLAAQPTVRPNIVYIVADDLDARSLDEMPQIPRLIGDQGVTFSRAYVAAPSCCPSRASMLRGQYPHNHGVLRNKGTNGGYEAFLANDNEASTVATWLQDAGYRTGLLGKYLNGYPLASDPEHVPPGWDEWSGYVEGYGRYFGYKLNEQGRLVDYGGEDDDYETDVLAAKAVDFIERAVANREPFFLYVAPHAPHLPSVAAPRHRAEFTDETVPRTPAFDEADMSDKPEWWRDLPPITAEQAELIDGEYRRRQRTLLALDDLVADVVAALNAAGALDSTYIVFTSDNGYDLGEHRLVPGKGTPFETATRVPLLVRGPGIERGRAEARLVLNTDLAPTFAEVAEAETPDFVDGRSIVPLLQGEEVPWRQALMIEMIGKEPPESVSGARLGYRQGPSWKSTNVPPFRVIVTPWQSLIAYEDRRRTTELYDLVIDPHQLENLAADPDRRAQAKALRSRLKALSTCAGAECRRLEDLPLGKDEAERLDPTRRIDPGANRRLRDVLATGGVTEAPPPSTTRRAARHKVA